MGWGVGLCDVHRSLRPYRTSTASTSPAFSPSCPSSSFSEHVHVEGHYD